MRKVLFLIMILGLTGSVFARSFISAETMAKMMEAQRQEDERTGVSVQVRSGLLFVVNRIIKKEAKGVNIDIANERHAFMNKLIEQWKNSCVDTIDALATGGHLTYNAIDRLTNVCDNYEYLTQIEFEDEIQAMIDHGEITKLEAIKMFLSVAPIAHDGSVQKSVILGPLGRKIIKGIFKSEVISGAVDKFTTDMKELKQDWDKRVDKMVEKVREKKAKEEKERKEREERERREREERERKERERKDQERKKNRCSNSKYCGRGGGLSDKERRDYDRYKDSYLGPRSPEKDHRYGGNEMLSH